MTTAKGEPAPEDFGIGDLFFRVRDAVIVGNAITGRVVLWNQSAQSMFGYSQEKAVGMLLERLVPEDLRERHRKGIKAYAGAGHGELVERGLPVELPALRADGTEIWVQLTLTPLRVAPGTDRFVLALVRDVTDRKDAERRLEAYAEELEATNEELKSSQQALEDFTAALAHDLRSPLSMIAGSVDALLSMRDDASGARADQMLQILQRQAGRLSSMVEELLEVARLERGAVDPRPEPINLRDALVAVVEAGGVEQDVEVRCSARLEAEVDPGHLRRIIENYLANALAHGAPPIEIEAKRHGRRVEVRVCDQGPGVATEMQPRLFERFSRGAGAEGKGLGLGLYTVKGLAVANGGDVAYEPNAPSGACFVVRLLASTSRRLDDSGGGS